MRHCIVILLTVLGFLSGNHTYAQEYVDLVRASYLLSPNNQFDNSQDETNIQEAILNLTLPVPINEDNALVLGAYTEIIQTRLEPGAGYTQLYTINPKIGLSTKYGFRWSSNILLLPKISSDLAQPLSGEDWQMGVIALMKYKKRKDLQYRFGFYYNSEVFGPLIVPILGLYYQSKDKKYEVNLNLPLLADANMRIGRYTRLGVNFYGIVRTYNLDKNIYGTDAYVTKISNEPHAYLQFRLGQNILLETMVGYSVGRSYRTFDRNDKLDFAISALRFGDNRTQINTDFSDGLLIRGRLSYRFYL
jgi:hypothetical protein